MTAPYFDSQASAASILGDDRLQPDLLLPAQWNARSRPIMEPEARLIWAIFDAAWHELLRSRERHAAEVWFANPNYRNNSGFSLVEVCDCLDWDADLVREAARARVLAARDPAMPDDPIPTELACELLGVGPNRVHDLARRGKLRAVKDGGKRCWYSRREVESLIAAGIAVKPHQSRQDGFLGPDLPSGPSVASDGSQGRLRACGHPFTFANSYRRNCLICHRVLEVQGVSAAGALGRRAHRKGLGRAAQGSQVAEALGLES